MNVRRSAAVATALALAATGSAQAAVKKAKPKPKPPCQIIKDETGDTFLVRAQDGRPETLALGPKEDGFDITSADLASDGKVVTGVVRVKKLSTAIQTSPLGAGFAVDFLLPTSDLVASMRGVFISGQQPYFEVTMKDPEVPNSPSTFLGLAKGFADMKKNEVHISAPVGTFAALGQIKKGTLLTGPTDAASVGRAVPPSPGIQDRPVATRFAFADVAPAGKPYRVGTPSCVTPGK